MIPFPLSSSVVEGLAFAIVVAAGVAQVTSP